MTKGTRSTPDFRTGLRGLCCALALFSTIGAAPALAHGLKVFAYSDGRRVEGRVQFVGGAPVEGARVSVLASDGLVLAELESAADGTFGYVPAASEDQLIRARTAEGHVAEWQLHVEDLPGAVASPKTQSEFASSQSAVPDDGREAGLGGDAGLETLVERAVARQIRPMREQLIAYEERVRLRDLIGGVGYIFGLAGFVLWWRSRRSSGGR